MKYSAVSLAALVGLASAASPISVHLEKLGNTKVRAVITNTADKAYNIFHKNTILDSSPVDKLHVATGDKKADFHGIRLRMKSDNLSEESFTPLAAGESKEVVIDMAEIYDVAHGDYNVAADGALRYAEIGSTELAADSLSYSSNSLSMAVNGAEAAKVVKALDKAGKRSDVQSDCTGSKLQAINTALSNCQRLATSAASAAQSGSASKFNEYFKTTDSSTRQTVHDRLTAVARECSSATSGATDTYCTDVYNDCGSDVLAYTIPSRNDVAYCSIFFSELPALTSSCHRQDQATTMIHEDTHAPGVYSPGTKDLGYGYANAQKLTASTAKNNADTYALYANAIYSGC